MLENYLQSRVLRFWLIHTLILDHIQPGWEARHCQNLVLCKDCCYKWLWVQAKDFGLCCCWKSVPLTLSQGYPRSQVNYRFAYMATDRGNIFL